VEEANHVFELNAALLNAIQTTPAATNAVEISKDVPPKKANAISQVRTAMVACTSHPSIAANNN
jgi:hypothetical protein